MSKCHGRLVCFPELSLFFPVALLPAPEPGSSPTALASVLPQALSDSRSHLPMVMASFLGLSQLLLTSGDRLKEAVGPKVVAFPLATHRLGTRR